MTLGTMTHEAGICFITGLKSKLRFILIRPLGEGQLALLL